MPWGKKAALVAYEKATGKVAWTTPNPKGVSEEYQSPIPMTLGGRDMILATGQQGYLIGVDAKTGKQLFEYEVFPKARAGGIFPRRCRSATGASSSPAATARAA